MLPDSAKEKPQRGKVRCRGSRPRLLDSGERGELSIAVGDEVIYGKYGGTDIEVDGDDVKILRETTFSPRSSARHSTSFPRSACERKADSATSIHYRLESTRPRSGQPC